jgi:mannose/fructose/N-acetylgalactosamine-specific phosphotransferase system component IIB
VGTVISRVSSTQTRNTYEIFLVLKNFRNGMKIIGKKRRISQIEIGNMI